MQQSFKLTRYWVIGLAFVLLSSALLIGCSEDKATPEAGLKTWMTELEAAVEAKSVEAIDSLVSDNYRDNEDNDKAAAMKKLQYFFDNYQQIHLKNNVQEMEASGDFGRIILHSEFSQSSLATQLGLPQQAFQFVLLFERDADKWLLNELSYQAITNEN